jgi:hypothetical protein
MGVSTTITCDNPSCPGNDLDPSSFLGWIQMQVVIQVPTEPDAPRPESGALFYCSPACSAAVAIPLAEAEAARTAPEAKPA